VSLGFKVTALLLAVTPHPLSGYLIGDRDVSLNALSVQLREFDAVKTGEGFG
jgi:hypothetical protein